MEITKTFYAADRAAWRAWLEQHHDREREIWLVYYKKGSGRPRVPYNDAVEEALCFGWIDSTMKPVDADRSAQRFTPRRRGSGWSEPNKQRARRLIAEGRMTAAGLAALGDALGPSGDGAIELAPDIREALQGDATTWVNYEAFPDDYKRLRIAWIEGARSRAPIFEQRLRYFLKMTAANKRYGMLE